MEDNGTKRALATLVGTDLTVADADELAAASRAVARLQSFTDLAKVQISRRTRQLSDDGDTNAHHVLIEEGRLSGKDAKNSDERDRVCEELPEFEDALADGRCTAGHVDAVATHTKDLTDAERADLVDVVDDLIDNAADQPIGVFDKTAKGIVDAIRAMHRPDTAEAELERQRKASKVKRWTDKATGMKHTMLALDPIRDAALWGAVNHHLERLRHDPANKQRPFAELQVEAFIAATSAGEPAERIPEIILVADTDSICHGRHPDTVCETIDGEPIPPATAQRLCCEALLTAVIVNADGTVDQVCEEQRTANRKQRRQLAAMYSTCAHPHCQVGFSNCRIHHIVWFSRGGKTVLGNLVPLCETHHHLVHEGGWNLTIDDQRRLTWYQPDGTIWHTDDGPNRAAVASTRPNSRSHPAPDVASAETTTAATEQGAEPMASSETEQSATPTAPLHDDRSPGRSRSVATTTRERGGHAGSVQPPTRRPSARPAPSPQKMATIATPDDGQHRPPHRPRRTGKQAAPDAGDSLDSSDQAALF